MIKKSVLQRVIFRKKFREILAAEILPITSPFLQKLVGQSDALKESSHFISNFTTFKLGPNFLFSCFSLKHVISGKQLNSVVCAFG